jgi:hypothetical protein
VLPQAYGHDPDTGKATAATVVQTHFGQKYACFMRKKGRLIQDMVSRSPFPAEIRTENQPMRFVPGGAPLPTAFQQVPERRKAAHLTYRT